MITRRFIFQVYDLSVHVADVTMPDAEPFVTMYKYGKFHHSKDWSDEEKRIAARALREGLANPRQPSEALEPSILPNN